VCVCVCVDENHNLTSSCRGVKNGRRRMWEGLNRKNEVDREEWRTRAEGDVRHGMRKEG